MRADWLRDVVVRSDWLREGVVSADWLRKGVVRADWLREGVVRADWLTNEPRGQYPPAMHGSPVMPSMGADSLAPP